MVMVTGVSDVVGGTIVTDVVIVGIGWLPIPWSSSTTLVALATSPSSVIVGSTHEPSSMVMVG